MAAHYLGGGSIYGTGFEPGSSTQAWERVLLAGASSSTDANSLLVGSITETAGDAGTTSITIDADGAASAYTTPTAMKTYYYSGLTDANGDALAWSDSFDVGLFWEIITLPGADSEMICYAGITSDSATNAKHVGIGMSRTATNPNYGRFTGSAWQSNQNANVANTSGTISSPKDFIFSSLTSVGLDSSEGAISGQSACNAGNTAPALGGDPVDFFVSFGVEQTGAASDYTVVFRLWRTPIIKRAF